MVGRWTHLSNGPGDGPPEWVAVVGRAGHSVALARTRLTVGQDGAIEAIQQSRGDVLDADRVELLLAGIVENLVRGGGGGGGGEGRGRDRGRGERTGQREGGEKEGGREGRRGGEEGKESLKEVYTSTAAS